MSFARCFLSLATIAALLLSGTAQAARNDMEFLQVIVEADSDTPRACFTFSGKLEESGDIRYGDYVRFEPAIQAAFEARGKRLCVTGFSHGQVYQTTLLEGLPSREGYGIGHTESFTTSIPDREPSIGFRGASYILPSRGERALPIDTVNVDSADVRILRINDRNLIGEINSGRISSLLSRWDMDRVDSLQGETVWRGVIDIEMEHNKTVSSFIPVGEILGQPEPGIYIVMAVPKAKREHYVYNEATQWMVVTDIGMTSIAGDDGLHVFLRSLQDAVPLGGSRVQLIARNNEVLGEAITDANGMAGFDPGLMRGRGGKRPGAVMAFGAKGEFSFLDLTKPAFDLTDRGVGGRAAAGPVDGFVYTGRGVYRPGETVNIVALLRDEKAVALGELPLKMRFLLPDGTEHDTVDLVDPAAGGYHHELALSKSARTGKWTVQLLIDPKAPPVGAGSFQVEDFVPERMEVKLEAAQPRLTPGEPNQVDIAARFLYGAPAANLRVEAEMVLQEDRNPYPGFKGYRFGRIEDEWRPRRESFDPFETDAEGRAALPVRLDEAPDTSRPLKALVRVAVSENGGRAVARTLSLPVRATDSMIGIKPKFGGSWLEEGSEAGFDVILLDGEGQRLAGRKLQWELFDEYHRYRWYREGGNWRYRVIITDNPIDAGEVDVAADEPGRVAVAKGWGRYRLEVRDPETGAATSVRFRFGWFSSSVGTDVPDKLRLSLDKDKYRAGEVARIHVEPPFAGELMLTVAGGRIYETKNLTVPKEGSVIELPVSADWDAGAYVTATLFRTADEGKPHQPSRAIGLAWLARDYSDRTLDIAIDAPARMEPRQTVDIGLSVDGLDKGEKAYVTLAAVDVGILQLTDFKTPAPADWYYGKRRLGVDLRDGYGYLIAAAEGGPVTYREGGDAAAEGRHLGGLDASSVKTVSLFSGIVAVGADGKATVPLDVPDFNGRLRLMAVAWSEDEVGSAETDMIVRDPLVSQVTLPRFLAPGDRSSVTVTLHNVDGPAGAYNITFDAVGAVEVTGGPGVATDLMNDERKDLAFTLEGKAVGTADIALVIEGPLGLRLKREWEIAVRPSQTRISQEYTTRLQSGQRQTLTGDLLDDYLPGSGEATVTLSTRPDLGLAHLLRSLDRYPYGCAEQTTSRALPLLYVSEIAASLGIAENEAFLRAKVEGAIRRVLSMQRFDGSFGLWDSTSPREEWLTAYVMDFLMQAKKLNYPVPDYAYRRGFNWLRQSIAAADYNKANLPARVYALYLLARAGSVEARDLRYVHDTWLGRIPTPLARAQLGAALSLIGENSRAAEAFASATLSWDRSFRFWDDWWFWDYGTSTRDMAATVYLATVSKTAEGDWLSYAEELGQRVRRDRYLSTQEKAWLILAARELGAADSVKVSVRGRSLPESERPVYLYFGEKQMLEGIDLANRGDEAIWQTVTYSGVPRDQLPAEQKGFAISRSLRTLDGHRVDLRRVKQGDTLVALIEGEVIDRRDQQVMVVDLLPAGFELDNASLAGGRGTGEIRWLPKLTRTKHEELRDDRYVAALEFNRWGEQSFRLAYIVRAVSPGEFTLPAIYVEDMYKPTYFARGRAGKVAVTAAR